MPRRRRVIVARNHQPRDHHGGAGVHHRRGQQVSRRVLQRVLQQGRVKHQHRARQGRHADGHDQEQVGGGEPLEIGPDQQGRFDHADEDVGRRRHAGGPAEPQRAVQRPGEGPHDAGQNAPIEQQGGKGADHQHQGQGLKRQDEAGAWERFLERQVAAADIAEHHLGPGQGRVMQDQHQTIDGQEQRLGGRKVQ